MAHALVLLGFSAGSEPLPWASSHQLISGTSYCMRHQQRIAVTVVPLLSAFGRVKSRRNIFHDKKHSPSSLQLVQLVPSYPISPNPPLHYTSTPQITSLYFKQLTGDTCKLYRATSCCCMLALVCFSCTCLVITVYIDGYMCVCWHLMLDSLISRSCCVMRI